MACKVQVRSKIKSLYKVVSGGCACFVGIALYNQNADFYSNVIMPTIHSVTDAETAHRMAISVAKNAPYLVPDYMGNRSPFDLVGKIQQLVGGQRVQEINPPQSNSLSITVLGMKFSNPIGLAAGFDKNAEAIDGLSKLGFGFVEVGTVTPMAQEGNDKPRVFRILEKRSIINRYGFNNDGHEAIKSNLDNVRCKSISSSPIIGLNLGKNKSSDINSIDDYLKGLELFSSHKNLDYFTINISSPNTPGLRTLQSGDSFSRLLDSVEHFKESALKNSTSNVQSGSPLKPVLIKIAPDLDQEERKMIAKSIVDRNERVMKKSGIKLIDGIIVSNTTITRPGLSEKEQELTGGLSGEPLKSMSTELIRDMYKLTKGQLTIIGAGGISTGMDAFEKIAAGSSLVQVYTCLALDGPPVINKIKVQLTDILREKGFSSVSEAVGSEHRSSK